MIAEDKHCSCDVQANLRRAHLAKLLFDFGLFAYQIYTNDHLMRFYISIAMHRYRMQKNTRTTHNVRARLASEQLVADCPAKLCSICSNARDPRCSSYVATWCFKSARTTKQIGKWSRLLVCYSDQSASLLVYPNMSMPFARNPVNAMFLFCKTVKEKIRKSANTKRAHGYASCAGVP